MKKIRQFCKEMKDKMTVTPAAFSYKPIAQNTQLKDVYICICKVLTIMKLATITSCDEMRKFHHNCIQYVT